MAALQYLDSLRNAHPELSDWHITLSDLYQRKLWHQPHSQARTAGDALIQLYHNFITDFETKINLLKLAHFCVIVSQRYSEKEAAIKYLEGVIQKLSNTRESRLEEPVLYIKMQIGLFKLLSGEIKRNARIS
ncbi:hypothetical protein M569_14610 [Genlisea aurea]|uniref:PSD13 N-terminal domain-containing protein n=1 Tax=Genlisea aurea TaxID=192259 RepID=S8C0L5_9LAMI|nr:hypothetical protein M569_14610 [Genlisea aurea]